MEALEKVTKLEELSHKTFYEMGKYSQLIIDFVSDIEDDLEDMTDDEKGAEIYQLTNVLEIIDKTRVEDIEALELLIEILS